MNKEEIKIKEFDKEQLEILLNDLQDIDKFTGFKDGAFKYELGKYQANLLVDYIKKQEEVIDKATEENKILKENSYHNDKVVDKVNWENMLLKKENEQLKDNWNKLKEYLENKIDKYSINLEYLSVERMIQIKNKMQELEQGSDSNEKKKVF